MKNKVFWLIFIMSIVTNILGFTNMTNNVIYFSKFLLPLIQIIYFFIFVKRDLIIPRKLIWTYLVLLLVLLPGIISSSNFLESLMGYISIMGLFANTLIIFPLFFSNKKERMNTFKIVNIVYIITIAIIVLLSIFIVGDIYYYSGTRLRYTFLFNNPNALGTFSFFGIVLNIILLIFYKKKKYLLGISFFLVLSFLSDARTSLYSSLIALSIFMVLILHKDKKHFYKSLNKIKVSLLLLLPVTIIIVLIASLSVDYNQINNLLSGRLDSIAKSFSTLTPINFLFGTGVGEVLGNPHNGFLKVFIEFGLVGSVVIYMIILVNIFSASTKDMTSHNYDFDFIMKYILTTFLIYSLFESIMLSQGNFNSVIIWIVIGYLMTKSKDKKTNLKEGI